MDGQLTGKVLELAPQILTQSSHMYIIGAWIGLIFSLAFIFIGASLIYFSKEVDAKVAGAVIILVSLLILTFCGYELLSWHIWPEAKLLQSIMHN